MLVIKGKVVQNPKQNVMTHFKISTSTKVHTV